MEKKYSGVWVYAEHQDGIVTKPTLELIGKGRELADKLGTDLSVVLFGQNVNPIAEELASRGVERVYVADDERLKNYRTLTYAKLLTEIILKNEPEIILFTANTTGRDLAPRVAARLGTGLTADCVDLDIGSFEDKERGEKYEKVLYQIVPAFGGNLMATIVTPRHRPQMATVRPGVFETPKMSFGEKGEIVFCEVKLEDEDDKVEVLEVNREMEESSLENAKVIVGGGMGVGGPEGLRLLKELADALGGEVGVTRVVTDAGWMPRSSMIGISGKTIKPKVYVACGISGALHHMIGVKGAGRIIAINKDPKAPIFEVADYIIVGDVFEIIPKLTEKLKKHTVEITTVSGN